MTNPLRDTDQPSEGHDPSYGPNHDRLQSPHDRLITQTLQQIEAARKLIGTHLPIEITQYLKLETLEPVDTNFVDRNLRRRIADRLFSVQLVDSAAEKDFGSYDHILIFVLIEHKSTDQPLTLIQMLGCIIRIWENMLENQKPLAPIIPWVIYNGLRPWKAPKSLDELIPTPLPWKRFIPSLELAIMDIRRTHDSTLTEHPILHTALTLLKYGRDPGLYLVFRFSFRISLKSDIARTVTKLAGHHQDLCHVSQPDPRRTTDRRTSPRVLASSARTWLHRGSIAQTGRGPRGSTRTYRWDSCAARDPGSPRGNGDATDTKKR